MYKTGDVVFYRSAGLCRIEAQKTENMGQGKKDYYVLRPLDDEKSLIHIPCDNELLCARMKELLSPDQINALIRSANGAGKEWIASDRQRTELFKSILESGDRQKLLYLWKSVDAREEEIAPLKKKLRSSDESFRAQAKKLLMSEFSFVLGLDAENLNDYIKSIDKR